MKKVLLAIVLVVLSGCKAMDRVNPTDPAGTNYGGWTYLGEIGSFSELADFTVIYGAADSIIAVDKEGQAVSNYLTDGTNVWVLPKGVFAGLTLPTGACELGGYCYVIDRQDIDAFEITTGYTTGWSDTSVKGDKILSYNGDLYVVTSNPPGVSSCSPDIFTFSYGPLTPWTIAEGDAACNTCMSYISDIAVHSGPDEFMLVDSGLKRISVFSTAGAHLRNIEIGADISSVVSYGNTVYVPTTDGIRRYDYGTGALIDTIANYGEGNGRVMSPGPIDLYINPADNRHYIFVGADTFIKVFEIGSF